MTKPLTPPPMTRERIQHVYDTHVGDPTEKLPHTPTDWEDFAQAVATARDAQWAARVAELERDAARLREALQNLTDPKKTPSEGDPYVLREYAQCALSSEGKGAEG